MNYDIGDRAVQIDPQMLEQLATSKTTWTVQQDDLLRYAAAARDFNKIHYDAAAAKAFGFDRPIAHGMLNLGLVLARVADIVGVDAISSSTTRFSAPAYVGAEVTLAFESTGTNGLVATITNDGGKPVLNTQIGLREQGQASADYKRPVGELVAERWVVVEQGPATRFAATLGAVSDVFHRKDAAAAAGFDSIPVLATYGFVLPSWGFFPELEGNETATMPDTVGDCQEWAQTQGAVAHAGQGFTHSKPLLVGDLVHSQTLVVNRASKQRGERTLRFTDVHSILTDSAGAHILTSAMTLVASD